MTNPIIPALRLLGHFWLEEIKPADVETIAALPELAEALPDTSPATLDELAVEYQRLFGFNLPPYESVFVDPSAMLMAPATELVQSLYRRGGWQPPGGTRSGAPDHLGLELLAWADWLEAAQTDLAQQLHTRHLALWGPLFIVTLRRLKPAPFYALLSDLTLDLLLTTLSHNSVPSAETLFPELPLPSVYRDSEEPLDEIETYLSDEGAYDPRTPVTARLGAKESETAESSTLRWLVKRLLPPRQAGLFLTREDLARLSRVLDLPVIVGARFRMLESLFRQAGQYDIVTDLFDQLGQLVLESQATYEDLAAEYPAWVPYAQAWQSRLATTEAVLEEHRGTFRVS